MSETQLSKNAAENRYEAHIDGTLAGFAVYQLTDELIVFTHTEVQPEFEGRGVGSALARFALDDVREEGTRKVLPICPFIKAWMARHPDYFSMMYGAPASTAKD
ncbi:GNAT family N-acetyltransferase [Janibacter sp. GXQ6167]|uniref:GNAT family N-acetyltransferase n=1 Tax=Janibacter sp. GXQ6167 TaxID=3240791 RepID=UPI0035241DA3